MAFVWLEWEKKHPPDLACGFLPFGFFENEFLKALWSLLGLTKK
jgi:hypothetical protein